mgnify:CR=1 FL=1
MGKIYIIMGKSATGKDTIYKKLLAREDIDLKKVVIYTTRPIRKGEREGVEYHFVDEDKLNKLKKQGKIIEHRSYDTIHGKWHYFTVDDGQIDLANNDYLMIGTLEAYDQIRKHFGQDRVLAIYLEVEDSLRLERALKREQTQEEPKYTELCRRFLADEKDFSEENLAKYKIYKIYRNEDINACISEIVRSIKNY